MSASSSSSPHRVLIDCDPGVDDSMALLLALASPEELTVEGITIVMGNHNDIDLLSANACLILQLVGRSDIPIVKGANKPLVEFYHGHSGIQVHGQNGIGNIDKSVWHGGELNLNPLKPYSHLSAAQYLVQKCVKSPGEFTVLALGPLTNIALAVAIGGQKFIQSVKKLVLMGGATQGIGNKTVAAEANLANDPHAGRVVFDSFPDIVMAGLNVTHQIELSNEFRSRLRSLNSIGRFCYDISTHYVELLTSWGSGNYIHDPTAVMYLIRPELFQSQRACVDVEEQGRLTSGQTIADFTGRWGRPLQTLVLTGVKLEQFYDLFVERIGRLNQFKLSEEQIKQAESRIEASETS
jgi:purine nucleosidase